MENKNFRDLLQCDLSYPLEYDGLFDNIEKADQLSLILKNKDFFVRSKINSCQDVFNGKLDIQDLIKKGFITSKKSGEIRVIKEFTIKNSLNSNHITIEGPATLEKDVIIGRSNIIGPVYISKKTEIFDSILRSSLNGTIYIGKKCSLWDNTVIIRSFIGDNSMIHTCNINDSIIGPQSNFGATNSISKIKFGKDTKSKFKDIASLDERIVLANYSYGNKIRILDPTKDNVVQTDAEHLGAISGSRVWLASGTIIYPGTIIGSESKITCSIPLIGYIPPKTNYSLFLSAKRGKIDFKGTLKQEFLRTIKLTKI